MSQTDWTFGGTWPYEPRFVESVDGRMHYVVRTDTAGADRTAGADTLLRSRLLGPPLVKGLNVATEQFLFKAGTAHPEAWDETAKTAYRAPHPDRRSRTPMLVFPREIPFKADHPVARSMNSTSTTLKAQMGTKPVAISWGSTDVLFGEDVLNEWQRVFPHAQVRRLPESGHFVPEDAPQQLLSDLRNFVGDRRAA